MAADHIDLHHEGSNGRGKFQFRLRALFVLLLAFAVLFALFAQFPRQSAFGFLMCDLLAFPLVVAAVVRSAILRIVCRRDPAALADVARSDTRIGHRVVAVVRFLGLSQSAESPCVVRSFTIAVVSTLAVIGLWPLIREIGLYMALVRVLSTGEIWEFAKSEAQHTWVRSGYWLALWRWESWALARWWLLFAAIAVLWLAVSAPFKARPQSKQLWDTIRRLFAFAPWLTFLEVTFLIGVWLQDARVVPEPSTGFVVGVFSWDLWHWDCWLDREWLIRGALPTFAAGTVFFHGVLRWHWVSAAIGGIALVPIALMLSIASTVLYGQLFL
jgi:hypothetical protein